MAESMWKNRQSSLFFQSVNDDGAVGCVAFVAWLPLLRLSTLKSLWLYGLEYVDDRHPLKKQCRDNEPSMRNRIAVFDLIEKKSILLFQTTSSSRAFVHKN